MVFADVGTLFAELARLRGLFGIDFIVQDGRVVVLEINPRPTASLELYERIFDQSFLQEHANVFSRNRFSREVHLRGPDRIAAKNDFIRS